jgi:hypothetical protein
MDRIAAAAAAATNPMDRTMAASADVHGRHLAPPDC